MKKITLLFTLLMTSIGFSQQTTFAVFTDDTNIGTGTTITAWVSNNTPGFATITDATTNSFEGSTHKFLDYVGSVNEWFMSTATGSTANLTDYAYYNIAIKTSCQTSFWLRLKGGGSSVRVTSATLANYGFAADGNWHFLSIPITEFTTYSGQGVFNIAAVTEFFVLRSDALPVGTENDFEVDNIYFSKTQVLSTNDFTSEVLNLYPNPSSTSFSVKSKSLIEKITVYNVLGKNMLELNPKSNSADIDVSSFSKGLYLVKIESNGNKSSTRFVKN